MIGKKSNKTDAQEKILDVDASMQGRLVFNDPVNLSSMERKVRPPAWQ